MRDYAEIKDLLLSDLSNRGANPFISSDMSEDTVRCYALRTSFYKKLAPSGEPSPESVQRALDKFLSINRRIKPVFTWDAQDEKEHLMLEYWKQNFAKVLDFDVGRRNFDLDFIRDHFAGGPGASIGADAESFYTKFFASPLSATSDYLITLYRGAISDSDSWALAEKQRFQEFGNQIVEGSKLFFVLKTEEIARTCCTEPMINMLIQKALGAFVEERLLQHFGVSLKTQPNFNAELARQGSIDQSFGTIDLASASDSISWNLMQQSLPSNLLGFFRLARCERTTLPDGTLEDLRMISTMGNGFTFPLQTVIFACAIRSVYQLLDLKSSCPRQDFGVFGDDIVVRREAYTMVCRLLQLLGFEVNDSKSFNVGAFRESCGHDYFKGHLVRGVYITSLETVSQLYSAINRLNRWSGQSGIPLTRTVAKLLELLGHKPFRIPFSDSDDAGWKVPFKMTNPKVDDRYWFHYRKLVPRPPKRCLPESAEQAEILEYKSFNGFGAEVTLLGGYAVREDNVLDPEIAGTSEYPSWSDRPAWLVPREEGQGVRYPRKVARVTIPYWDWAPCDGWGKHPSISYAAWEAAVTVNR